MNKHGEPWAYERLENKTDHYITENAGLILFYDSCGRVDSTLLKRIVACVNACAGMDDPAEEIADMRAAVADMHDWADRDE